MTAARNRPARALTPNCPQEGTVTGTTTPAQVVEAVGQGILAGEFEEVVDAIRAGRTYANVHSATFPPGEIRGHMGGPEMAPNPPTPRRAPAEPGRSSIIRVGLEVVPRSS